MLYESSDLIFPSVHHKCSWLQTKTKGRDECSLHWNSVSKRRPEELDSGCKRLCLYVCSHEPPEWPAAAREASAHHSVQTHERSASSRRARGPGPDQRLQQLPLAPLQEARLQELFQHLPAFCHLTPFQHSVSPSAYSKLRGAADPKMGKKNCIPQIYFACVCVAPLWLKMIWRCCLPAQEPWSKPSNSSSKSLLYCLSFLNSWLLIRVIHLKRKKKSPAPPSVCLSVSSC